MTGNWRLLALDGVVGAYTDGEDSGVGATWRS
jgi:hypothetical protein